MKVLIKLNHPAHYHLFKNLKILLEKSNNEVYWLIKKKDILEELLNSDEQVFKSLFTYIEKPKNKYLYYIYFVIELLFHFLSTLIFCYKKKPDIMIGTDVIIAYVGKILRIPSIITNEDDYHLNKAFCNAAYPNATYILTPNLCNVGPFNDKKIGYNGYQKLSYLHPMYFKPNIDLIKNIININKKFFIIRIVAFQAIHDFHLKASGFTESILDEIILLLKKKGEVILSSERPVSQKYQKLLTRIPIQHFHHALYFCDLFISDSQSMSVEASMLGVPSVKFNSHVGTVSICEELEKKYKLNVGVHSSDKDKLINTVKELMEIDNLKETFQGRRMKMLNDKVDVTDFFYQLLVNYPQSIKLIKNSNHKNEKKQ